MSKRTRLLNKLKHVYSHNTKLVLDVSNDDIGLIIEALEKQIKKKPEIYTDTITTVYEDYQIDVYECGNCGSYLCDVDGNREYTGGYCECCGQKIDWSEVE